MMSAPALGLQMLWPNIESLYVDACNCDVSAQANIDAVC